MLCENLPAESPRGAVRFREPTQERLAERAPLLSPADLLRVEVPPPSPRVRGRLAEVLEQAVEQALEGACAPPPGIDASLSRDASLSDQLFRARAAGFRRLELSLGSLERLALSGGAMDPRDTDALVFWVAATRDRPVQLVLDAGTSSLPAYGPTVELGEILLPEMVAPRGSDAPSSARVPVSEVLPPPAPPPVIPIAPLGLAPVNDTRPASSAPPPVAAADGPPAELPVAVEAAAVVVEAARVLDVAAEPVEASADAVRGADEGYVLPPAAAPIASALGETKAVDDDSQSSDFAALLADSTPAPAPVRPTRPKRPRSGLVHLTPRPGGVATPSDQLADAAPPAADAADHGVDEAVVPVVEAAEPVAVPAARVAMVPPPRQPRAPSRIIQVAAPLPTSRAADTDATPPPPSVTIRRRVPEKKELDAHAEQLASSRGPRPLAQVERMFVERYVPLSDAELHGEADDFQRGARHEWAGSFAKSYADAWSALRVSGKRPQMVMDAPALASATARLHGARAVELFLVDGMRYDLGCMVHDRLRTLVAGLATCADRTLLWSALPSTTASQLDSLARGPEALMGHGIPDDDSVVVRGRAVSVPRRIRVGNREIMKLDLVEARLRELGPPLPERFASLADEIATAVARHIETLPPRTLAFVFGDHGFLIDGTRKSSGPARQGGSSPDEVLVPAFSWLTGGVG